MYIHSLFTWVDETFDHQIKQFYWQVSRNAQTDRSHNWSKADFSVEYVLDQNPDYLSTQLILNHLEFLREQVGFWIESKPTTVLPLMKRLDSTLKKTDDLKDWIFDLSLRLPYGEWFKFEKLSCVYGPEVFMETPNDLFLDHDSDFEF